MSGLQGRPSLFATCALVAVLGGLGCGGDLPPPTLRAVSPSTFDQGQAPVLLLELDAALPLLADHRLKTVAVDETITVRVGTSTEPVWVPLATSPGLWHAPAPFGLQVGQHDVEVTLADGRSALLPEAVTVREVSLPDGFSIDPVGAQRRGVPFTLTVRATGPASGSFAGVVSFSINRGNMTPAVSEPFVAGVLTQEVTVGSVGDDTVITVQDAEGHFGASNGFRVNP